MPLLRPALVLALIALSPGAHAQKAPRRKPAQNKPPAIKPVAKPTPTGPIKTPTFPIEKFTLPNGLRVVLSPDPSAPLVAVNVAYHVGSRNEVTGRTGFAHLFEHMMFQGSQNVARGMFFRNVEGSGGRAMGTTRDEFTQYDTTVSPEKLPLVLWMEADRMRSLAVTQANLDNQREVVKEEKRLRLDNQPYAAARAKLRDLFWTLDANRHLPIGSMRDLDDADLAYNQKFYETYYAPNNAVLVIVGDFDPKKARELVEAQFASIPKRPAPPKPITAEPPFDKPKRTEMTDPFATMPAVMMAWRGPSQDSPDAEVMPVISTLLFGQGTQRAGHDIGADETWVLQIVGRNEELVGPAMYMVTAVHRPVVKSETIENEIKVQIDRLCDELPSASELERVKTRYLAETIRARVEPLDQRAVNLAQWTLYLDKPEDFYGSFARVAALTPQRVQEVARKYFATPNYAVVHIKAGKSSQGGSGEKESEDGL